MVPFQVTESRGRLNITWESLFWFAVVTAVGTVVGTYVYNEYVQPYLNARNAAPGATTTALPKTIKGTQTFIPKGANSAASNIPA